MRNWMKLAAVALVAGMLALSPNFADAKGSSSSSGRSSNGYSRPSTPSSPPSVSRPSTPSPATGSSGATTTSPSTTSPSTGSSAKGYALPGQSAPSATAPAAAPRTPLSGSDAALSRQASGSAFKNYTAQQERAAYAKQAQAAPASPAFSSYGGRFSSYDSWYAGRSAWYGGFGWGPPAYVYYSRPSFGMWDAMFLWFMLDSISSANHAAWFYNHYQDPGYQDWRREADRLAADNADLRAKLNDLDDRIRAMEGQPRDANYLPPDAKPEFALASDNVVARPSTSSGHPTLYFLLGLGAIFGTLFMLRRARLI